MLYIPSQCTCCSLILFPVPFSFSAVFVYGNDNENKQRKMKIEPRIQSETTTYALLPRSIVRSPYCVVV